jgi:hypothetical protein
MSKTAKSIAVILVKNDVSSFLVAGMIRNIGIRWNLPVSYHTINRTDRRTWPSPNKITSDTWLYMIGDLPPMPLHEARAKGFGHHTSSETESVATRFFRVLYPTLPVFTSTILPSHERTWSHSPLSTPEDWGLRDVLFSFTEIVETKGMMAAFDAATLYLSQGQVAVRTDLLRRYYEKRDELLTRLETCKKYTIHLSDEAIAKNQLPTEWLNKTVRLIDTTDIHVDTGLLSQHVRLLHPDVDILIQYRKILLNNNLLHKYYCRALKDVDLLSWKILKGHSKGASGESRTKTNAPFTDTEWMESIDDMPTLTPISDSATASNSVTASVTA